MEGKRAYKYWTRSQGSVETWTCGLEGWLLWPTLGAFLAKDKRRKRRSIHACVRGMETQPVIGRVLVDDKQPLRSHSGRIEISGWARLLRRTGILTSRLALGSQTASACEAHKTLPRPLALRRSARRPAIPSSSPSQSLYTVHRCRACCD